MPTLNWIGKDAVVNHHHQVPFHLLKEVEDLSCGDPGSGNLIVQGDNLVALKALLPYYAGQVKCIYIDPPYNTGTEGWIYNDNVSNPIMQEWLGKVVGKEDETLDRHDRWLCMMYPRLALLRQFLLPDGILMMSIDDNEGTLAKLLLNDHFGSKNFIAQLVWEKGRKNDAKLFSVGHEYILVYAKDRSKLSNTIWRAAKDGIAEIAKEYQILISKYGDDFDAISKDLATFYKRLPKGHPSKKYSRAKNADHRGVWRDNNISWHGGGGPKYDLLHPKTGKPCKIPEDGWRFVEESMKEKIKHGWVVFRKDHTKPPILKSYIYMLDDSSIEEELNEGKKEVLSSVFYRHSQPSNDVMKDIFGEKIFPNPKDHEILSKLIRYVTSNDKDSIIMDSFSGSGTTGHAVLSLNSQDSGNRRVLLVEMEPSIAKQITAERIRRIVEGYKNSKGEFIKGLGGGFRYCELGQPLFDENGKIRETVTFSDLARHVYFTETGEPLPKELMAHSPFIGSCRGVGIYLLYNGVLHDKKANGGNVLTRNILSSLPQFHGPKVIYCTSCLLGKERLNEENIIVRQIPYEIKVA